MIMVAENDAAARFVQAANKKQAARVARRDTPRLHSSNKPRSFRQKLVQVTIVLLAVCAGQALGGGINYATLIGCSVIALPYLGVSFYLEQKAKNEGGTGV